MTKIISWNINGRKNLWNSVVSLKSELDADVVLLQEAPSPPNNLHLNLDSETAWRTTGSGSYWRTAVVGISDNIYLRSKQLKSVDQAGKGDLIVSRMGTLAAADLTIPETNETIILISMYSVWESPVKDTESSWIYADASAHRLISDISALIGRQNGHKIIAAGDLNLLYGYGEGGSSYWARRYETVFSRMESIGLNFAGPQLPFGGIAADPHPSELPLNSQNVPTFRPDRRKPQSAARQLDYVFTSSMLASRIKVRALNKAEEWGESDHCRILIELSN